MTAPDLSAPGEVAPVPRLVVALTSALAERGTCALDPELPGEVWHDALVGPATAFLARPGKDLRARLVRAGWLLAGAQADALPDGIARVIELLHAGSLIVDDVEDDRTDWAVYLGWVGLMLGQFRTGISVGNSWPVRGSTSVVASL